MEYAVRSILIPITLTAALLFPACAKHPAVREPIPPSTSSPTLDAKEIVVATVNGVNITLHALNQMTDRIIADETDIAAPETNEETRKKALDRLIFQELAYEEAVRSGWRPDAGSVDSAVTQFINSVGPEKGYKEFLQKEKLTLADLRSQIERSLMLRYITATEVTQKISVTDQDARKEYEKRKDQFVSPEKVSVTDVVFFLTQNDEASMRKAGEVLAAIKEDMDKSPWGLARDNSFIVRELNIDKEKEPVLYDAARKLKEGELSGVLRTKDSIHIIQLAKFTPERQIPFEEVGYAVKGQLRSMAQKVRLEEWKRVLRKDAKITLWDMSGVSRHKAQ